MPSIAARSGSLAAVAAGTLLVAWLLTAVSSVRVFGTTVPTQLLVGTVAGLLTLSLAVSQYRGGDRRSALQFGLLGVGVPLALSGWGVVASVGAGLAILSAAVAWRVDRRLRERVTDRTR